MGKNLKKKLGKKGFTLAELLIVVAIIGVLVAISIPIFSSQLEKSRENTDVANLRDAKAAAVALYLDNNENAGVYFYDAEQGCLVTNAAEKAKMMDCPVAVIESALQGYGKGGAKIGDKNLYFKMSTDPDQADNAKEDLIQHKADDPSQITAVQNTGGTAGIQVTVESVYDKTYSGQDEVKDDVIKVGISSNDGALGAEENVSDYIYLEWVAATDSCPASGG